MYSLPVEPTSFFWNMQVCAEGPEVDPSWSGGPTNLSDVQASQKLGFVAGPHQWIIIGLCPWPFTTGVTPF